MTSQINPSNINDNYPVAGQPNNTQGFRDNFSGTKNNFTYAADEITALQSSSVLKQALSGTTLDNNMNDNLIYAVQLSDVSYPQVTLTTTSGTTTLDYSAGMYQTMPTTSGSVVLAFSNWPLSGSVGVLRFSINITNTAYTLTLPSSVTLGTTGIQGYLANVITFAATGTYEFEFQTSDGGTTIAIFDLNRPLNYYTNTLTIGNTAVSTSSGSGALIVAGGAGIAGNLYVSGNIVGSIVATGNTFVGNTTVGNLLTSGFVSASGNITGGNVLTGGLVSATGNITGGNLNAVGLSLSGNVVSAINLTANVTTTANVSGGNVKSSGIMSSTGNVTGGNILTGGLISATSTITSTANVAGGNITTAGQVSATGNITGGNILSSAVISAVCNVTILSGTALPAGGTNGAGLKMSSTTNLGVFFGSGAPTLSAAQGSLYIRTDGSSTTTRMYVNINGTTGWTNVVTSA